MIVNEWSFLTIVDEGPSLTIVNEGSLLTIVNKMTNFLNPIVLKNERFEKR